jgi:Predicted membrane protein (DUF2079)
LGWSLLMFLCLSKFSYLGGRYLAQLDTWQTSRIAIAQIPPQAPVLATAKLAPHLAHRQILKIAIPSQPVPKQLANIDYILLDRRHPGDPEKTQNLDRLIATAKQDPTKRLLSDRDGIYLFAPR